jgi:glycosyltransferase involved in cell wall biosynthesis
MAYPCNKKLKILFISEKWYPQGKGGEIFLYHLSKKLSELNHKIFVISAKPIKQEVNNHIEILKEIQVFHDASKFSLFSLLGRFYFILQIFRNLKKIKSKKIDVIHSISPVASSIASILAFLLDIPIIISVLSLGGISWQQITNSKLAYLFPFLEKFALKYIPKNKLVIISQDFKDYLNKIDIPDNKIEYIPNGINVSLFNKFYKPIFKEKYNIPENIFVLGYLGALESVKNVESILSAYRKLDQEKFFLLIAGEGPLANELKDKAKKFNLSNYKFLNKIEYNQVPSFFASVDVLILPSISEGFPSVCLESLLMKTPVIATNVGEIKKIIIHNKNGFIIKSKNKVAEIVKYCNFLKNNINNMKIKERDLDKIKRNFSWNSIVNDFIKLYYKSLKN